VTFNRSCPVNGHDLCNMPCAEHEAPQEQPVHFHVKPSANLTGAA
jgi:hypothetical protein